MLAGDGADALTECLGVQVGALDFDRRMAFHCREGAHEAKLQHRTGFARQRYHARAPAELRVVRLEDVGIKSNPLISLHFVPYRI